RSPTETAPVRARPSAARPPAHPVVPALGTPPPRPRREFAGDPRYLPDPWAPDVVERVGRSSRALLLGTGLTMVDVVAVLHDAAPARSEERRVGKEGTEWRSPAEW